jgi:hypothetical protein
VIAFRSRALYASWNGSTEAASFQLLQGPNSSELQNGPRVARTGFETLLTLSPQTGSAAVVALDATGAQLGRSATLAV